MKINKHLNFGFTLGLMFYAISNGIIDRSIFNLLLSSTIGGLLGFISEILLKKLKNK